MIYFNVFAEQNVMNKHIHEINFERYFSNDAIGFTKYSKLPFLPGSQVF